MLNNINNIKEVLLKTVELLEELNIEYFLYGGIAVDLLGYPRFTADVDIVIKIKDDEIKNFLKTCQKYGFKVNLRNHFKKLKDAKTIKLKIGNYSVDFVIGETFFDLSAFKRRKKIKLFNKDIFIVSKEDIILYKLISKRYIDLADIEKLVIKNKKMLDLKYLKSMADKLSKEFDMPHIKNMLKDFLNK